MSEKESDIDLLGLIVKCVKNISKIFANLCKKAFCCAKICVNFSIRHFFTLLISILILLGVKSLISICTEDDTESSYTIGGTARLVSYCLTPQYIEYQTNRILEQTTLLDSNNSLALLKGISFFDADTTIEDTSYYEMRIRSELRQKEDGLPEVDLKKAEVEVSIKTSATTQEDFFRTAQAVIDAINANEDTKQIQREKKLYVQTYYSSLLQQEQYLDSLIRLEYFIKRQEKGSFAEDKRIVMTNNSTANIAMDAGALYHRQALEIAYRKAQTEYYLECLNKPINIASNFSPRKDDVKADRLPRLVFLTLLFVVVLVLLYKDHKETVRAYIRKQRE